ncbi:peptidylprolyl isomerase [Cryobacterium sp. BB736]|uniref:peptidylprolyl isomerase n=1 Tax=Cryobacterium sp. BB736 TaxID=2746963 RepID=UPI0018736B2D
MAPSKSADREARQARERLRRFNARQEVHKQRVSRRKRDNVLAVIGVVVIAALATLTQVVFFTAGPGAPEPTPEPSATATPEPQQNVGDIPDPALSEFRTWTGELVLNDVPLAFELDGAAAPQAVAAFVQQVQDGYFVDKTCHRLTDAGVKLIQCGSLDGTGAGDPDFRFGPIENAPEDGVYPAGTIAMARAGGDAYSQGHQFFIMYEDGSLPDDMAGGYTVFGKVTDGLDRFIEEIASGGVQPGGPRGANDGAPVIPTTITSVSVQ